MYIDMKEIPSKWRFVVGEVAPFISIMALSMRLKLNPANNQ